MNNTNTTRHGFYDCVCVGGGGGTVKKTVNGRGCAPPAQNVKHKLVSIIFESNEDNHVIDKNPQ